MILKRANAWIEKWIAFVTPTCLVLGVLFPEIAVRGAAYVPVVFAFMTFTGALKSSFQDIGAVLRKPLPLLLILSVLHVVMPCAAWSIGEMFFAGNRDLITGMVLEFSVPAAVVGMMWVSIYKGDSSITLSLLVIDTVLAPFIIPLTLKILVGARVKMNPAEMMKDLVFMIALPALLAMCLNRFSSGKVKEKWPGKLAFWSKLCLIYCVICNSSKVAPYVRYMNLQRVFVAVCIMILAAAGYAIGWGLSVLLKQDEKTRISMIYGSGMRNISAGAVIAAAYFPGEVMFPVMIGTLFQQVLAACYGSLIKRLRNREKGCKK